MSVAGSPYRAYRAWWWVTGLTLLLALLPTAPAAAQATGPCVKASVVALDQVWYWNRLGAVQPQGMMYALSHDVISDSTNENSCLSSAGSLTPGQVRLRRNKRPRPLVLRMNVGQCMEITFRNLLNPVREDDEQPNTRDASIHVVGMQNQVSAADDGLWIGQEAASGGIVSPGNTITYRIFAEKEGTFLMYNGAAMVGGGAEGGSIGAGLFGAINVQPAGSRYFRSQVTEKDLTNATTSAPGVYPPVINYTKKFSDVVGYTGDPDYCWRPAAHPILEMLDASLNTIHSDLTAIVTGPTLGAIAAPSGITNWANFPVYKEEPTGATADRIDPFREFTIIFHDEVEAVQAFPHFEDRILSHTLHSVRDAFAINYGAAGAGAEVLANRLGVGPMYDCIDCKYEEFFLASWAVGDPAMVVDVPANSPCNTTAGRKEMREGRHTGCFATVAANPGPKATRAFYPDDPSNVYHSYMNDNVRFRNLHAGSEDHHIFHLHAHQWLRTPNSDKSAYLDSQSIGQGTSFTYEIAHGGSGNLNKTVGDSIFHCHFYPHFAQGMWSLWRVHDVLELGTKMGGDGRPLYSVDGAKIVVGTRALPDSEIRYGTPIPGLVPIPGEPMPPPPTAVQLVDGQINTPTVLAAAQAAQSGGSPFFNPGYPFFIPGVAGHRAPHPPKDFALDGGGNPRDGGLPRHVVVSNANDFAEHHETRLDMSKEYLRLQAFKLPEQGTALELLAMQTHAQATLPTTGTGFKLNGRAAAPGAPYADPCPAGSRNVYYKAADIQLDVKLTKDGWHFPQQRIITLVSDVFPTLNGTRPPEPLFFRANSGDCINYELTNLVPYEYMNDDFQVKTPTDIIAQHIHLVKFDVTSSDGGGNGFNYEDGTFSPEEVQERIHAIRMLTQFEATGTISKTDTYCASIGNPQTGVGDRLRCPVVTADPRFGNGSDVNCDGHTDWLGAQTTVQRWWADPTLDLNNTDRTLRTVFTHDHFGPSSHQQVGLYAGLVIEPLGSRWYHNEQPIELGGAAQANLLNSTGDGSPTSWQARVEAGANGKYREFMLEFSDFQLAYERDSQGSCPDPVIGWANPAKAINPPGRKDVGPHDLYVKPDFCPVNGDDPDGSILAGQTWATPLPPCPEAVSAADPGFGVVNYRAEPLAARIKTPGSGQTAGRAGDPSFAYETRIDRANPEYNKLPYNNGGATGLTYVPYPALTSGLVPGDPFTPLMRVYEGDRVHVRSLVGGFEEEHSLAIHAARWLYEPDDAASGYKAAQQQGISEWFDYRLPPIPFLRNGQVLDMLYKPSAAAEWQWGGMWGLIRVARHRSTIEPLFGRLDALSDNPDGVAILDEATKAAKFDTASSEELIPTTVSDPTILPTDPVLISSDVVTSSSLSLTSSDFFRPIGAASTPVDGAGIVSSPSLRPYPYPPTVAPLPTSCPLGSLVTKLRPYTIAAVAAREVLPSYGTVGRSLIYNWRTSSMQHWGTIPGTDVEGFDGTTRQGPLHDPTAILFVPYEDLTFVGGRPRLRDTAPVEPLVLRAKAGDCLRVRLINLLPVTANNLGYDIEGWSGWQMLYANPSFNSNDVKPSQHVSLHPQLVSYDPGRADGTNVGINPQVYGSQSVAPNNWITYYWYAGIANYTAPITLTGTAVEFGTTGLSSSDPLKGTQKGAVGALIIEPANTTTWLPFTDPAPYLPTDTQTRISRASATVSRSDGTSFREFVVVHQDDINLQYGNEGTSKQSPFQPVENLGVLADPTESGQKALNYRTEPIWFRMGYTSNTPHTYTRDQIFTDVLTDAKIGNQRPVTPIFSAQRGKETRFRVVHPGGHTQAHVFEVTGHIWPERPYNSNSTALALQNQSQWQGTRYGVAPMCHYDSLIQKAGGAYQITGEYLYRDYIGWGTASGMWGIFKVTL